MANLRKLVETLGPRDLQSGGERRAAEFLEMRFRELGYAPVFQEFTIGILDQDEPRLTLLGSQEQAIDAVPFQGSAQREAEGALAEGGLGRQEDLIGVSLQGKIALLERGQLRFQEKVDNVEAAGAVAAVIYNNEPGRFLGALLTPSSIPVVGITREEGEALKGLLGQGEVRVRVQVKNESFTSQNVIAEKRGATDRVVVLGGHYDTVPEVPGALDNASGVATVLALAEELSGRSIPVTVRFIAFGGEELGLFGSRQYAASLSESDRGRIVAMLNFDVVAAPVPLAVSGDPTLAGQLRALDETLASSTIPEGATSDHVSFQQVGIPAVAITTPDFRFIHTPQDTLDRTAPEPMAQAISLVLAYLLGLGQDS